MSRGNARQRIFEDDLDYRRFQVKLAEVVARFDLSCQAYCLMPNHFHILLRLSSIPISRAMQQLNSSYSQWFNRRHGRVGHVMQGRFRALLVDNDVYLLRVLRYIVMNPVASGLVKVPEAWRWSSYRATRGLAPPEPFLDLWNVWNLFDPCDRPHAQELFEVFANGAEPDVAPDGLVYFGAQDLAESLAPIVAEHRRNPEFARSERFAIRPPITEILDEPGDIPSLDQRMQEAYFDHGYTLREIANRVGKHTSTVWRRVHSLHTHQGGNGSGRGLRVLSEHDREPRCCRHRGRCPR
jgi:putative transposase